MNHRIIIALMAAVLTVLAQSLSQPKYTVTIGKDHSLSMEQPVGDQRGAYQLVIMNQSAETCTMSITSQDPSASLQQPAGIAIASGQKLTYDVNENGMCKEFADMKIPLPVDVILVGTADGKAFNKTATVGRFGAHAAASTLELRATGCLLIDALRLSQCGPGDEAFGQLILEKYSFSQTGGNDRLTTLSEVYSSNPFLGKFVEALVAKKPNVKAAESAIHENQSHSAHPTSDKTNGSGSLLGQLASLDVATVADGLAKFMIRRAKSELTIAFFDKLKEDLAGPESEDIRRLFPVTVSSLELMGDQVFDYQRYLMSLRESFERDVNDLLKNIPVLIGAHAELGPSSSASAKIQFACFLAEALKERQHPGRILAELDLTMVQQAFGTGDAEIFDVLQLVSESFKVPGGGSYWVRADSIYQALADPACFKIFLGFLFQKCAAFHGKKIAIAGAKLQDILKEMESAYDVNEPQFRRYFSNLANRTDMIQRTIAAIDSAKTDSTRIERLCDFIDAGEGLLDVSLSIADLIPAYGNRKALDLGALRAKVAAFANSARLTLRSIRTGTTIARVLLHHNYVGVIPSTTQMLGLLGDETRASGKGSLDNIIAKVSKYGTFLASVLQAKSSDDVEEIVEAYALPPQSYRTKRASPLNVSINSYLGGFIGGEKIFAADHETSKVFLNSRQAYGVFAPVGIALSHGCSSGSYSVFVSLIDIGALAAFRLSGDSASTVPAMQLRDIFSPGVFISYGIPGMPISLAYGWQIGPNLHSVSSTKNDFSDAMYQRWSISASVDIPLMDLFTKQKSE